MNDALYTQKLAPALNPFLRILYVQSTVRPVNYEVGNNYNVQTVTDTVLYEVILNLHGIKTLVHFKSCPEEQW